VAITPSAFPVIAAQGSMLLEYYAKVSGDAPNADNVPAASVIFTISIVDYRTDNESSNGSFGMLCVRIDVRLMCCLVLIVFMGRVFIHAPPARLRRGTGSSQRSPPLNRHRR
jgi:hypothetical protein